MRRRAEAEARSRVASTTAGKRMDEKERRIRGLVGPKIRDGGRGDWQNLVYDLGGHGGR